MVLMLAADGDHLAVGLVVIAEVMLLGLAIHYVPKERRDLVVRHIGFAKHFFEIELQVTTQAGPQFAVARET